MGSEYPKLEPVTIKAQSVLSTATHGLGLPTQPTDGVQCAVYSRYSQGKYRSRDGVGITTNKHCTEARLNGMSGVER